ncbi:uncharacterized protein TM35_000072920 [Trypanosoma theileri]|uniref:Uncharacterized protein n=1 Tax=Trypanosoma theileri TaxID=67003 RepID=A0A1X0P209_9TRYP|nr:uncharacterized protein TM35_000072920 [Trypanosoma theileri]ORC90868.1 hypothetical protein TM35_000072920 [Trypanosoma theileri]
MSDLWRVFNERLTSAGYTLKDLIGNDSLFQIVAEEICGFAPQQVNELFKECKMYERKGGKVGNIPPIISSSSGVGENNEVLLNVPPRTTAPSGFSVEPSTTSQQGVLHTYPTTVVLSRAGTFLRHVSGNDTLISPLEVTEIPRSRKLMQSFRERLAAMHKPVGSIELLWKFCSPKMLDNLKNGYQLKNSDDKDLLCSSGIVLYRDNGTAAQFLQEPLMQLVRQGWSLVAFDTAVGKSRRLEEEEIRLLQHFPMEECFNSLNNDGYDSIRVIPCNAFVVFHRDQLIPRFAVSIQSPDIRQLNYSNIVNSVDSSREQNSFKKVEKDEKNDIYYSNSSSLPRVMKDQLQALNNSEDKTSEPFNNNNNNNNNIPFICHKHQGKEVEFWSPEEKRLLCSHCLFYEGYGKENCVLVVEALKDEAQKLEQWVQNALTFTNEIGTVTELFHSAEKDINRNEEERREEIREQFKRIHTKLNSLEGDLLAQVENKSGQQRHMLQNCFNNVQSIVHEVKRLIDDAKGPLSKYNSGITDYKTAVALLRVTQSAFTEWRPVPIPMYSVVSGWNRDILGEMEALLEPVSAIENEGQVELPEAVDVNYLKN